MAIRNIRKSGDEILRKRSKEVLMVDEKILQLLDDMLETMYEANGVGIAAVQVGVLKRLVVIDIGEGPIFLINPVITKISGEQIEVEGCLSVPGKSGEVKRPSKVILHALNRAGKEIKYEGEGFMAIAMCHELDHLDGILFTDKVIKYVENDKD